MIRSHIKNARQSKDVISKKKSLPEEMIEMEKEMKWLNDSIMKLESMKPTPNLSSKFNQENVKEAIYLFKSFKGDLIKNKKMREKYLKNCSSELSSELYNIDFYIKRMKGKERQCYSCYKLKTDFEEIKMIKQFLKDKEIPMVEESGFLYFIARLNKNGLLTKDMLMEEFGDRFQIVAELSSIGNANVLDVTKNKIDQKLLGI